MPIPVTLAAELVAGIAAAPLPEPVAHQLAVNVVVDLAPTRGGIAQVQREQLGLERLPCVLEQIYDVRLPGFGLRVLVRVDEAGQSGVVVLDPDVDAVGRGLASVAD